MSDDLRWAARYAFCEELWAERARIVWDRNLESVLASEPTGTYDNDRASSDPVAELLRRLLPPDAQPGPPDARARQRIDVSVGVDKETVARRLAGQRPGTQFLTLGPLCDAIRRRDWEVALADLSDLLVTDAPGEAARLSVRGIELIEALTADFGDGRRTVVLSAVALPAESEVAPPVGGELGVDYAGLLDIVAPLVAGGAPLRVFGVLRPTMAAVVELTDTEDASPEPGQDTVSNAGPRASSGGRFDAGVDADASVAQAGTRMRAGTGTWREGKPRGARWSHGDDDTGCAESEPGDARAPLAAVQGDVDEASLDDDVPLAYDNTLGDQEPAILEYIAVVGRAAQTAVAPGMTLIELPPATALAGIGEDPAVAPLRAQLVQSQRQADLATIERQALLERLDDLESANTALVADAAQLRDGLARALAEPLGHDVEAGQDADRLDALHGDVQSLRWELAQSKRLLDAARARPVEVLEADNAQLRARLSTAAAESQPPAAPVGDAVAPSPRGEPSQVNGRDVAAAAPSRGRSAGAVGMGSLAAALPMLANVDALLRRVERTDISALELRKRLVALRQGLVRRRPGSR